MRFALPAPGTAVWIRRARWRVRAARPEGVVARVDVTGGGTERTFLWPFDQIVPDGRLRKPRRVRPQRARARLAHLLAHARNARSLSAAVDARIDLMPHQLEPALAMLTGSHRVLIADDVGLGKTIQAGLVIADLLRREPAAHMLVLAPQALREQWRCELQHRFAIETMSGEPDSLRAIALQGARNANPWRRPGVWLASLDYLKQPHVFGGVPLQWWDLLVIDEAHTACGGSSRHAAAAALAGRSRRVLLLTATPHSGDQSSFVRLEALGRAPGVADGLIVFRRSRADIGLARTRKVRWRRLRPSSEEQALFDALEQFERRVIAAGGRRGPSLLLLATLRKRALSTAHALRISLARRQAWLDAADSPDDPRWQQLTLGFDPEDDTDEDDLAAYRADTGLEARTERAWIRRLTVLAELACRKETKISWLCHLIRRTREPVVIFTEFRDSLERLARAFEPMAPAVLHGGLLPREQHRELMRFLSGEAPMLLTTDVAAQGLNLHARARWVLSLDVPWNPVRLEQRAGRVDRLGQQRRVRITTLVFAHRAESPLLERLSRRVLAADRVLPTGIHSVLPDETLIRESILNGRALEDCLEEPPRLWPCTRLQRPARFMARRLRHRRACASRWRSTPADAAAYQSSGSHQLRAGAASLHVCSVTLLDTLGAAVETCVVPMATSTKSPVGAGLSVAIRAAALRVAGRRASRLSRLRAALVRTDEARCVALIAALSETRSRETQPGMFDRRALSDAVSQEREWAAFLQDAASRRARDQAQLTISPGEPRLDLLFTCR